MTLVDDSNLVSGPGHGPVDGCELDIHPEQVFKLKIRNLNHLNSLLVDR